MRPANVDVKRKARKTAQAQQDMKNLKLALAEAVEPRAFQFHLGGWWIFVQGGCHFSALGANSIGFCARQLVQFRKLRCLRVEPERLKSDNPVALERNSRDWDPGIQSF